MRRAATIPPFLALASVASAQTQSSDERFFMGLFLPLMVCLGVLLVVVVVVANVVAARRRMARLTAPPFDPTLGPGPSSFGAMPNVPPHTVSKTTTTTSADGSVTVTVIEETIGSTRPGAIGVVDLELLGGVLNGGALEQEILDEVRDAFRRIDNHRNAS